MGSAIVRRLANEACEVLVADRKTLDLTSQRATEDWLERTRPDAIFLAAGLVGGIHANDTYPADFITDNLAIALNVIRAAHMVGVKKLLALGSSCIYPKFAIAAHERRSLADRTVGADKRMVRGREDSSDQALRGLSQATRGRFHLGDANKSLRAQ